MDRVQISKVGTAFGVIVVFLCIVYEHYKRRNWNFKKGVLKRHEELKRLTTNNIKEMCDSRQRQGLILKEIEIAESLMTKNKVIDAINHFANAIIACEEPDNIIKALERTLPKKAFVKLTDLLIESQSERFKHLKVKKPRIFI